ncbi:aminopeptidase [Heliomicrobium gestii]|nr:aminopeptidase [Heliomicrobium gestii]MBM7867794.1 aspartyl aminopeptidase [Heliomicrobium gestii]
MENNENHKATNPLTWQTEPVWDRLSADERQQMMAFAEGYRRYLSTVKTERESVEYVEQRARAQGFAPFAEKAAQGIQAGDKVYFVNRNKAILLVQVGARPLAEGISLVGAHLDTPRIDLKPNPLYQDEKMALFKTHYYGGIKKYQWLTIPLALHGVTILPDGTVRRINLGEAPEDPVFTITDLLPHLAKEQMEKKLSEAIEGEGLNILVGGLPAGQGTGGAAAEKEANRFKQAVLEILHRHLAMTEEDFLSSEWQAVPAGAARDIGFDRAFVGGYGQDDRVCCYTAAEALFDRAGGGRTAAVLLVDKEETGSDSNTGMRSRFFENALSELIYAATPGGDRMPPELTLRRCLFNTKALSADVLAAMDPNYGGVLDERNAARMGFGVAVARYTGSRGKYGTSEANAEFMAEVRRIFQTAGIAWQSGELGKVDQGGGGTIAQFLAIYGMEVLDCGVPLLSMHAPFEVAHKADVYMAYRAYKAFLEGDG